MISDATLGVLGTRESANVSTILGSMIDKNLITGVILAGGRGSRMGGVDKGLQNYQGIPLALHCLLRISSQVGEVMINANRNLAAYESMGVPVWPDASPDFPGPLAGFVSGLERCETPYLVTIPCDTPKFPADLVERLSAALIAQDADIAMVATMEEGVLRTQPVFCLMKTDLLGSLIAFLQSGQRKIDTWTALHRCVEVEFEDTQAFVGANTVAELQRL
jgi:molybdopterin-guanine dinucleotide biosynthesis protein A